MRSSAIFVALAATAVSAQTVPTYKSSLNMTIDPNTVPQQQRGKSFCPFFLLFFSTSFEVECFPAQAHARRYFPS
jgi:hypothetical protein